MSDIPKRYKKLATGIVEVSPTLIIETEEGTLVSPNPDFFKNVFEYKDEELVPCVHAEYEINPK